MFITILLLAYTTSSTHQVQASPPPYPGKPWQIPKVHHSPNCLHDHGWHDVAGALTFKGEHHVFQGCPTSGGWSHAASSDLVHWEDRGIHISKVTETYAGMNSDVSPCSGFVSLNDQGIPCAGFRQCGSTKGVTELNPAAHTWDVPMEVRCAKNQNLTDWGSSEWIYPVYYYRALPYDPVRPWKDYDGKWYSALSTDGCNSTTKKTPCAAGGRLDLFTASNFNGPWEQLDPMFTTNLTYRGFGHIESGHITREFVTSGYFGGLQGDPDNGTTRVVTQNNGGATYWVGKQKNGGSFKPLWSAPGAVGYYDYGSLTMARTLGSASNQVAENGRRVLVGWIGGTPASQSLARDLTLSSTYELLQKFVPELQSLRLSKGTNTSSQVEIIADFWMKDLSTSRFGVNIMCDDKTLECAANIFVDCTSSNTTTVNSTTSIDQSNEFQECQVGVSSNGKDLTTAPLLLFAEGKSVSKISLHAIVDGEIIEIIFNNRTAMVVYVAAKTASATGVVLFGTEETASATMSTWDLSGTE